MTSRFLTNYQFSCSFPLTHKSREILVSLVYRAPLSILDRLSDDLTRSQPIRPATREDWLVVVEAVTFRLSTFFGAFVNGFDSPKILLRGCRYVQLIGAAQFELMRAKAIELVVAACEWAQHSRAKSRFGIGWDCTNLLVSVVPDVWLRVLGIYQRTGASGWVERQAVAVVGILVALSFAFLKGFCCR